MNLHAQVLPSLLAGTSRHPLRGELEMLSLMGQALCFERPSTPDSFIVESEIKDDRHIVAGHLRRPLVRVLTAKNLSGHPARALARAFDRLRLRPHPFDLPLLEAFVRSHAERLGATAQYWADRQKADPGTHSYFDPEQLNESNWTQATLSRRTAYLELRRREDADAARALAEANWGQENADARFRLLQTFQRGLSMADQPFLSSLESDRAARVRGLAARLLARLGMASSNPALGAVLERIKQGQSGILRKRTTLQLELPANVKDQAAAQWIRQTFADVSFDELAATLKLSAKELIEAAAQDDPLMTALALVATTEARLDLIELVVAGLPRAWERMLETGLDTLGAMEESERRRWQEIVVHPYRKDLPANYFLWDWLFRVMDAEPSPAVMSMVLHAKLLPKVPDAERASALWVEMFAAMCPSPQRPQLREQLASFDPSQTVTALTLLEILDGMENDPTHV